MHPASGMKMKAAVLTAPGRLDLGLVPVPACPPGGVLVEIKACGICTADAKMVTNGHRALSYPRIPGHEIAGLVIESRCGRFDAGDRVQIAPGLRCGRCRFCRQDRDNQCERREILGFTKDGGFAQYIGVPLEGPLVGSLTRIPDPISYADATLAEPIACCINAQEKALTKPEDAVLIVGAGPVGLLHGLVARDRGASVLIFSEIQAHRREAAERAGADGVVDPSTQGLREAVMEFTRGRGVDVVIFACSRVTVNDVLLDMLAPCGRVSVFSGTPASIAPIRMDSNTLHYKEIAVSGAYGCTARQNAEAIALMASRIRPSETLRPRNVPLESVAEGLAITTSNSVLKAILEGSDG